MTDEQATKFIEKSRQKIRALIAGLEIIQDRTTGASFYNSSGDSITFTIATPLTDSEAQALQALDFEYRWYPEHGHGCAHFREW
jgi:hypothetical protein